MSDVIVFLDLETTGLNPVTDSIIEIGAIKVAEGKILDRFDSLVNYSGEVPSFVTELTGITTQMLSTAPPIESVFGQLLDFIEVHPIAGHNISFDVGFLSKYCSEHLPNKLLDTVDLARIVFPLARSYRLEQLAEILEIDQSTFHRAMADSETSFMVYEKCREVLSRFNMGLSEKIYNLCQGQDSVLGSLIAEIVQPSLTDFSTQMGEVYGFQKAPKNEEGLFGRDLDSENRVDSFDDFTFDTLYKILHQAGPFALKNPAYKYRAGQVEMLSNVADSIKQNKHLVIEAGTGTGKSLAYLLPAIKWARQTGNKVVVATNTINLQEQLWTKEIPYIKKVTGWNFDVSLVKGRNNYICLRKWEEKVGQGSKDESWMIFLLKLLIWLYETQTGDKNEITLSPAQQNYWREVSADSDSCMGPACPWFSNHCFTLKARRNSENAHLLVVNHSLLLADLKTENRVLPPYDYLIVDEAHNLEESATEQLGWGIGINSLKGEILALNRGFGSGNAPGLLNQLKQIFRNNGEEFLSSYKADEVLNSAFEQVKLVGEAVEQVETHIKILIQDFPERELVDVSTSLRITNQVRNCSDWISFGVTIENLLSRCTGLSSQLKKISLIFEELDKEEQKRYWSQIKELDGFINFLLNINSSLTDMMKGSEESVFWIDSIKNANYLNNEYKLNGAPISVSNLLYDYLFSLKKSIVLTSATLSVDGRFEHFVDSIGLNQCGPNRFNLKTVKSPFEYAKQAMLCVARDLPEPGSVPDEEYIKEATPVISSIVTLFEGRTMCLFTSHKTLMDAYKTLKPELEKLGITVLGHRIDGGRSRVIAEFAASKKAVLLGANSFWEGVDLPGDMLKCVIVVRLPFAPPNSPVHEARIEQLAKLKKDGFRNYLLPRAVIRLKQGFGRLIRTEFDEGAVVILDRRIVDKSYGRLFLNSLPLNTHVRGDSSLILQKLSEWTDGERESVTSLNILENITDLEAHLRKLKTKRQTKLF